MRSPHMRPGVAAAGRLSYASVAARWDTAKQIADQGCGLSDVRKERSLVERVQEQQRNGKNKGKGKRSKFSQSMHHGGKGKIEKACLCCGRKGHVKRQCRFNDEKCSSCGKTGHLKAVC